VVRHRAATAAGYSIRAEDEGLGMEHLIVQVPLRSHGPSSACLR
jgi:hypothetical protein